MSSGAGCTRKYFPNALPPMLTQDSYTVHFLCEMFFVGFQLLILIHEAFTPNYKHIVFGAELCIVCLELLDLLHRKFKTQLCLPPGRQSTPTLGGTDIGQI